MRVGEQLNSMLTTERERLERIAHLLYEWGDMMNDGPDDSDVAMANGWLVEAFQLAREHRRAKQAPSGSAS